MTQVELSDGTVEVDAGIIAEGLGMALALFQREMQAGLITSVFERGTDADHGRHRITFFSKHRRFRLVVDERGAIVQRSTLNFGDAPLPASVHSHR
jgi:Family of unknown function (DUF6522)